MIYHTSQSELPSRPPSGSILVFNVLNKLRMPSTEGRIRVVVEGVRPEIDCGAFPAKRIAGDRVIVEADIFTDGHDLVAGEILYRHGQEEAWRRSQMKRVGNDRWRGD